MIAGETARGSRIQRPILAAALAVAGLIFVMLLQPYGLRHALLLPLGMALGLTLYHAAFGFAGAYRRAIVDRDISGVVAQAVMLAVAIVLFAPMLAAGEVFGRPMGGALAPVGVSMVFGAFLFGVGMQVAGGCASGTLYTAGGGNARMLVVLAFFCIGGFRASLDLHWWSGLPGWGAVSLPRELGWPAAVALQLAVLGAVVVAMRWAGGVMVRPLGGGGSVLQGVLWRGPWPLVWAAVGLAVLNALTLVLAGHPWSITWAFALWPAKIAHAVGWDPTSSPFWSGGFQAAALARPLLADSVSVMNVGILLGALAAAALAGRVAPDLRIGARPLAAAVIGGFVLGYGARLAYGCNIGAFFSGVASGSLHGWVWIAAAVVGTVVGIRLRPLFALR